ILLGGVQPMPTVAGAKLGWSAEAQLEARGRRGSGRSYKKARRSRAYAALGGGGTYFANCSAARAAGAAPVRAGQPGYSRRLDRDGDGVGCE
ncbi:excalibur calcium-binding domain-containing protein, partial [Roseisolibacter sp. H3M3-2]|uniref:excalibur calcium-binding domain-containing protein n=1 Tax=Roseisolibacter sp. H3M3-2 TaxID=3031323 RepID=UPI0023DA4D08